MISGLVHKRLDLGTYSIHYYTAGKPDGDTILFLHQAFGDHRCFEQQVDAFASDYRVISVDLLGHGRSQRSKSRDGIDATASHLLGIMAAEGVRTVHLVGVSVGSLLAQHLAMLHPDRVKSITAVGGYAIHLPHDEVQKAMRGQQLKWLLMVLFSMKAFRRSVSLDAAVRPEAQRRLTEAAQLFGRRAFPIMAGLQKITQVRPSYRWNRPLLLVSGGRDRELAKRMAREWHAHEPQSRYVEIPDAGHSANMDESEEFNAILSEFLGAVAQSECTPGTPSELV